MQKSKPPAPVAPRSSEPEPPSVTQVTPEQVKQVLEYGGDILNGLGVSYYGLDHPEIKPAIGNMSDELFRFTKDEIDNIAGPLANVANRHAVLAGVMQQSDELAIALVVGRALVRNYTDTRAALAIAAATLPDEPEEPDAGLAPENEDVPIPPRDGAGSGVT